MRSARNRRAITPRCKPNLRNKPPYLLAPAASRRDTASRYGKIIRAEVKFLVMDPRNDVKRVRNSLQKHIRQAQRNLELTQQSSLEAQRVTGETCRVMAETRRLAEEYQRTRETGLKMYAISAESLQLVFEGAALSPPYTIEPSTLRTPRPASGHT